MRILGIDPGIATIGFAVLDSEGSRQSLISCGVIETPARTKLSSRLDKIFTNTNELISTFQPDEMAVEELFFNTNVTTGISVAHGRGVLLLAGFKAGLKISEYTPLQVKQAVVGYGKAEKSQVMYMVCRILGLEKPPRPDDAADAVAVALCHARSSTSRLMAQIEGETDVCSTT